METTSLTALPETVMPDYCNTGVIFRVLLAINAAVLAGCLLRARGWMQAVQVFAEASVVVELASLTSLFALCTLRRMLLRSGLMQALSHWAQRALCALVPAAITGVLIHFLAAFDWYLLSFGSVSPAEGMLVGALAGFALAHYFELRTRAYSPALAEARLQALQARIRPHFLFNSLNAVLSLIRKEPQRAEAMLEDLSDLFRVSMSDARSMTTLEAEIHLCQQYLAIEKARLGERLQVDWDASGMSDADMRQTTIAPLMLQPLIENAVHYGVEPALAPALIQVRLARSLDRVEISVTNPLPENAPPAGNQMALGNIRERLALLYDVEAQLDYGAAHGQFEVRLSFPLTRGAA